MSMTIFKYPIEIKGLQNLAMPRRKKILYVGLDPKENPCIWAEVDQSYILAPLTVYIFGTGEDIPDSLVYIGTIVQNTFVWHVYHD